MKKIILFSLLATLLVARDAEARKDCTELKQEIATKIEVNGVKAYRLEIASKDEAVDGKVVGSCNGGTQQIVYQRLPVTSATMVASKPAE